MRRFVGIFLLLFFVLQNSNVYSFEYTPFGLGKSMRNNHKIKIGSKLFSNPGVLIADFDSEKTELDMLDFPAVKALSTRSNNVYQDNSKNNAKEISFDDFASEAKLKTPEKIADKIEEEKSELDMLSFPAVRAMGMSKSIIYQKSDEEINQTSAMPSSIAEKKEKVETQNIYKNEQETLIARKSSEKIEKQMPATQTASVPESKEVQEKVSEVAKAKAEKDKEVSNPKSLSVRVETANKVEKPVAPTASVSEKKDIKEKFSEIVKSRDDKNKEASKQKSLSMRVETAKEVEKPAVQTVSVPEKKEVKEKVSEIAKVKEEKSKKVSKQKSLSMRVETAKEVEKPAVQTVSVPEKKEVKENIIKADIDKETKNQQIIKTNSIISEEANKEISNNNSLLSMPSLNAVQKVSVSTAIVSKKDFITDDKKKDVTLPSVMSNRTLDMRTHSSLARTTSESIIYKEGQNVINYINPKKQGNVNAYYPGLRGPNQLIVYTPSFGLRTGTNEFGTEAIVEQNMVVRLNGADSVIPKNGYVISGHGKAKDWIIKNIQVGSKIYIDFDRKTIKAVLTPESLIFAAKEKLREVNRLVEYYRQADILYNDKKANNCLENSKNALRKAEKKPEKVQVYIKEAMADLDEALKNAIPYFQNEMKGIWIRPVETTPEQIEKTISRISSAGITDIFLETYFHGKTIYPSKYLEEMGVISQRAEFKGFDPLAIWIQEAHKRSMRVHVWFESFYVGNDNPKTTPNHVLRVYPNWANKRFSDYNSEDPVPSLSEHNGYFLDPSNVQVQSYLLGILNEIIEIYKPDGINLDYIRYPQTVDPSYPNYAQTNWGYTKIAREEFRYMYGIDPVSIQYGTSNWELWSLYRQNQVTDFLKRVKALTAKTNILVTAVVFPDLKKSKSTKMQNWKVWSMNNYVDGLTPLLLTGDKNTANVLMQDIINNTSRSTKIFPGLFVTFMGGETDELLLQIQKARELKTQGTIFFDYAHFGDKYIEALTTRVFNKNYESKEFKAKTAEINTQKEFKIKNTENYKPEVRYKEKSGLFKRGKHGNN